MLWALIFYVSEGTYGLMSTPNDRFLRKFFVAGLFTLRALARNLVREKRRRNVFFSYFGFDAAPGIRTRALHLISQHITY